MAFALYQRPGGVVFLDDDLDYLEMLAEVMPMNWYVRLFMRPAECIDELVAETPQHDADAWRQQHIVNRWREGAPLIPQIMAYWREDSLSRFGLTKVCVVDYSMPAMSGLRVLSEIKSWTGSRILLTGRADEQLAVSAFNRGLIEQFIPKQAPEIRQRLTDAIQLRLQTPDARYEQIWRATLSPEQHSLLCNTAISQQLQALAMRHGWVEHIAIGSPFGVLALDGKGQISWLQLEPANKLKELAEMAECHGWDAATVQNIETGSILLDLELQLALGTGEAAQPRTAFALGTESPALYAAIFPVNPGLCPGFMQSHERFIATLGQRMLRD